MLFRFPLIVGGDIFDFRFYLSFLKKGGEKPVIGRMALILQITEII